MARPTRPCPVCGEAILEVAKKCRHCGEYLDPDLAVAREPGVGDDLKRVARYQKGILLCIAVYLLAVLGQFIVPQELRPLLGLAMIPVILAATVCVFLLATQVYSPALGIVLGILTLVPLLGLIVLLHINQKATVMLTAEGVRVGLLGARMSDL